MGKNRKNEGISPTSDIQTVKISTHMATSQPSGTPSTPQNNVPSPGLNKSIPQNAAIMPPMYPFLCDFDTCITVSTVSTDALYPLGYPKIQSSEQL